MIPMREESTRLLPEGQHGNYTGCNSVLASKPLFLAESMQVVSFPARKARTNYRHELCHLTYVILDAGNGGIIRNLNSRGAAVQAVGPLRPHQQVRLRFDLTSPRLRVETHGEVKWARPSGQCGIRFVDMPILAGHQIDEWIFSDLLDVAARHTADPILMFAQKPGVPGVAAPLAIVAPIPIESAPSMDAPRPAGLNWLSRPLSGQTLARIVDGLLVFAAFLLFAFIFLTIVHDLPHWPLTLAILACATACAAGAYWGLFSLLGEATLGVRLAQAASGLEDVEAEEAGEFR